MYLRSITYTVFYYNRNFLLKTYTNQLLRLCLIVTYIKTSGKIIFDIVFGDDWITF